ncbi:hypothetical protein Tco_0332586, partial [Tanacetum coccineum]
IYTVEFQKRGLPYAHVCLFLHKDDKVPNVDQNDKFISAEIPDKDEDPDLYKLVTDFMMHGPCDEDDATQVCMTDGKYTKHFPKKFTQRSSVDSEGYPVYRRRDNGRYVESIGSQLHNGYVVRYNATLLKRYQYDINVEWCNQTGSIKYLFKYINKGHDRVSAQLYEIVTNEDDQCQVRKSPWKAHVKPIHGRPYLAILSSADNRPPMLEKDMYDSWKSIMKLYMMNRQHGRMILESVENGLLIWPMIEENGVTRPRKYSELTPADAIRADCDVKASNIILQGLPPEVYALVSNH